MAVEAEPHPKDKASYISRVTLWWIAALLRRGYKRPLEHNDLYPVRDREHTKQLTRRLNEKWEDEKKRAKLVNRRPLLWKSLLRFLSWKEYALVFLTGILRIAGQNIRSFCIIKLISILGRVKNGWEGPVLSCGIVFGLLMREIALHHFHLCSSLPAIRMRAATLGLICDKVSGVALLGRKFMFL